ncbi:hypothetical protein SAMN05443665_1003223 [Actinomadura meyerae]|uniref:Uncharacterized protein n=1 Tax=Actinomadura meyerae TaxID=240840 RepID=A0A239E4D3_9ACTN|nr:hypothetical protein [Actinomadura meyerae]SNS39610.1 hypothetical protein SAMN05443665_1003223 [Actinomadura meyerae]
MGVTADPRPLVVAAADGTADRLAVEAELRRRRWRPALAPAEAGALVVCGRPGPALAEAIETVWRDMPEPRRRGLDGGGVSGERGGGEREGGERPPLESGAEMADRADDRDGLRLDVLHVPLGPVLPYWPAGLRVDLTLQGDVVQAAEATAVDRADETFWTEDRRVAARLDSLSRFLRVAGWDTAAERAAVLRDEALTGASPERPAAFVRRVRRSLVLRWMTRGFAGVRERVEGWLREIEGADAPPPMPAGEALGALPSLLEGAELGEARLIVASLDPDLGALADG